MKVTLIGKLFQFLNFPGMVRPVRYRTRTGLEVWIDMSERYTMIHLGNEVLYFWRESGYYDGWSADVSISDGAELNGGVR